MSMMPDSDTPFWEVRGICAAVRKILSRSDTKSNDEHSVYNALYRLISDRLAHGWYGERNSRYHDLKQYMDDAAIQVYPGGQKESHLLIIELLRKVDQNEANIIENYMLEKYIKRLELLLG